MIFSLTQKIVSWVLTLLHMLFQTFEILVLQKILCPFTIHVWLTTLLQNIIEVLESQSGPGGLHENTFLLVMGDHGQTINGDHGGGTAEEV